MTSQATSALYREVTRAAWTGLVINLALGMVKLGAGIVTASFALVTDAVNSLGDVVTSIVVLFAFHVAQQPADDEHPYGHTRAEAIAGSNVALIIILTALGMGWEALARLRVAHPIPPLWTLGIAAGNVVIKELLYRYKMRVGRRTSSSAIIANAWDHRADALSALAVLIGLATVHWGGSAYIWADEVAALVVVCAILWSGMTLFRKSASELMDLQAEEQFVQEVRRAAESVPEVKGVETLWVRKSGLEYFADIHIEVDPRMTVAEGHRIGHLVKDRLVERFDSIRDVLVHLEPWPHDHDAAVDPRVGQHEQG